MGPPAFTSVSIREPGGPGMWPRLGTTPQDGLSPKVPHRWDGTRMEPPMSLPSSSGVSPAATAAAAPPDEPARVRVRSQGLPVVPNGSLKVWRSPA